MAADRNLSSVAQLVREVIEEAAREKLAEVDRRMARGESPTAGKSPRGRKKKAD